MPAGHFIYIITSRDSHSPAKPPGHIDGMEVNSQVMMMMMMEIASLLGGCHS